MEPLAIFSCKFLLNSQKLKAQLLAISVGLIGLTFASTSFAHVKWFVDSSLSSQIEFTPYTFGDIEVQIWIAIGLFLIAAAVYLDTLLPKRAVVGGRFQNDVINIFRIFTGISLIITSYESNLVAPHLPASGWFGGALIFLQTSIGLMFIARRFIVHATLLLFVLLLGVLIQHGMTSLFEYINIVGIALFFLFNNIANTHVRAKFKPYAVDSLRIFTGLALITLGITEKLSGAALGQAFFAKYDWNFMTHLGFEFFSDRLFVFVRRRRGSGIRNSLSTRCCYSIKYIGHRMLLDRLERNIRRSKRK